MYVCRKVVEGVSGGTPMHGTADREMDGAGCCWKPREALRPFSLLERSPVTNGFMLGRWGCGVSTHSSSDVRGEGQHSSISSPSLSPSSLFNLAVL